MLPYVEDDADIRDNPGDEDFVLIICTTGAEAIDKAAGFVRINAA